jgi:DNA-binding response OmpR family regulator
MDGTRTVVVVDAEEETRRTLTSLGQAEGCFVIAAASWQDALLALREHGSHLRLIIMSLDLPDLSWINVIGRLREVHRELPVIVTTTVHSQAAELFAHRLVGAALYAPKPLDIRLLRRAIRGALRTAPPLLGCLHESEEPAMKETRAAQRR